MRVVDYDINGMAVRNLVQCFRQGFQVEHIHVVTMHTTRPVFLAPHSLLFGKLCRPTDRNQVSAIREQGLGKSSSQKSRSARQQRNLTLQRKQGRSIEA